MDNIKKKATIRQLADLVHGETAGPDQIELTGINDVANAATGEITFIAKSTDIHRLLSSGASAAIVPVSADVSAITMPLIRVRDSYLAAAIIHNFFLTQPFQADGIHPAAAVGDDCRITAEVTIDAYAVLGRRVTVGRRVTIGPHVVIGDDAVIGDDSILYPHVTLYPKTILGARVIVHSGAVIGSDGFGFATDATGVHIKRPHVGKVVIEDDVEIGANVCIDRATFGITRIGAGTKIDNLVQIGHNVQTGAGCLIVSQVGIAGSASLGHHVVLGGQTAVAGHIHLGDRVMVGAKSGVAHSLEDGAVASGIPAIVHTQWRRAIACFAKLPEMVKELRELKKTLKSLLEKVNKS